MTSAFSPDQRVGIQFQPNYCSAVSAYVFDSVDEAQAFVSSQSSIISDEEVTLRFFKPSKTASFPANVFVVFYNIETDEIVLINEVNMTVTRNETFSYSLNFENHQFQPLLDFSKIFSNHAFWAGDIYWRFSKEYPIVQFVVPAFISLIHFKTYLKERILHWRHHQSSLVEKSLKEKEWFFIKDLSTYSPTQTDYVMENWFSSFKILLSYAGHLTYVRSLLEKFPELEDVYNAYSEFCSQSQVQFFNPEELSEFQEFDESELEDFDENVPEDEPVEVEAVQLFEAEDVEEIENNQPHVFIAPNATFGEIYF